jgi:hypothetical protein
MDTVSLSRGSRAGRGVDRDEELARVYNDAIRAGLGEEGARAAIAIALTEGGLGGAVGDRDRGKGSAGTFQLFFGPRGFTGMGNAYAAEMGLSEDEALERLSADPHSANAWALRGYLGQAIREGRRRGLSGAALAEYAQRHGQRSESPERAARSYQTLFSEGGGGPKVLARVAAQEDTMDETASSLTALQRRIETLKSRVDVLNTPTPQPVKPASKINPTTKEIEVDFGSAFEYKDALAAWEEGEKRRKALLAERKAELREAERDLDTLEKEARAAAKPQTPAQAATGARADERLGLSAEARAEASAKAGQADVQRGRELRRAGEYAWGPDGIPYGIYDDDGKLRLLSDKEQTRAIALVRQGAITRKREVPGTAQYPGQTPETRTVEETATLPAGVGQEPGKLIEIGRSVYQQQPDGTLKKIHTEPRDPPQQTPRQERFPEEIARDQQEVVEGELTIEKKGRDLLGPATVALQNHIALIDQVEKMVAAGQLKPEQASQYVATSEQNYQAALRGTTVAAEQEAVKTHVRERQTLGRQLLDDRVNAGMSLAAALTTSAFGSGVMMPKGATSLNYSPIAVAMETTDTLGGGPQVSDFAKSLLMETGMPGARPRAVPGGMPEPSPWLPPQREMPAPYLPPRRQMPA